MIHFQTKSHTYRQWDPKFFVVGSKESGGEDYMYAAREMGNWMYVGQ